MNNVLYGDKLNFKLIPEQHLKVSYSGQIMGSVLKPGSLKYLIQIDKMGQNI
ncbi:unnamed protein product [Paramecium sonneborni]|uniref:Uncharacterized protein n=1 Tax=Paramecium sonneborni TaxID=65129 RepID=A0A8S1M2Z9_9CILI|nr:unnamed protein product [Paramecium sonneborni]